MSGAVFEWYSSNPRTAYPFNERLAGNVNALLVDAYVVHNVYRDKQEDVRIAVFDPAGDLELRFEDGTVLVAFTSADDFQSNVFGAYTIYSWRASTTSGPGFTALDVAAQVVAVTAELANFSFPLAPTDAYLLASVVNPRVERARRMAVAQPELPCCTGGGFTGNAVALEAGNNVQLTRNVPQVTGGLGLVAADTTRVPTTIQIDVAPGNGAGVFVNCDSETPPIKLINAVGPNNRGGFALEAQDCMWVERLIGDLEPPVRPNTDYLAQATAALLKLHQDCVACCDCQDFGDVYATMSELWTRARAVSTRIEQLRKQYVALRELILTAKSQIETGLNVRIQALTRPDFHLAIAGLAYNNSSTDLGVVELTFELDQSGFTYTPGSGVLDTEFAHQLQVDPLISGDQLSVQIPQLRKTAFARYSFEVRYGPSLSNRAGAMIRATVTAVSGAQMALDATAVQLTGPIVKT